MDTHPPQETRHDRITGREVRRRRVHYISGFDPRGPVHYHRLYRDEAFKQQAVDQAAIEVGPRTRFGRRQSGWAVTAEWDGQQVETDYRFMSWDDIVRKHWIRSPLRLVARGVTGYPTYLATGGLQRARTLSRGAFISGILPLLFQLLVLLLMLPAALLGWFLGSATALPLAAPLMAAALAGAIVYGGLRIAERFGIFWLLRICVFIYDWGREGIPGLDERAREMADAIVTAQRDDPVDEVLIVGHSIGSMLAVSVAAELLRDGGSVPPELTDRIGLMTLGQCIPWLGFMPQANAFRSQLEVLARAESLPWIDVSGPTDPLGFYNVDPIAESGIRDTPPGRPRLVTARFFRMFHFDTYRRLRRDKLRLHFQYLMASELPADYDYFRITAGPRPGLEPFFTETPA